jgi:hypothetical protein
MYTPPLCSISGTLKAIIFLYTLSVSLDAEVKSAILSKETFIRHDKKIE